MRLIAGLAVEGYLDEYLVETEVTVLPECPHQTRLQGGRGTVESTPVETAECMLVAVGFSGVTSDAAEGNCGVGRKDLTLGSE